jgi:hypothetical protein
MVLGTHSLTAGGQVACEPDEAHASTGSLGTWCAVLIPLGDAELSSMAVCWGLRRWEEQLWRETASTRW